ncbi:hypothetical protein, unlikely [Trypanosoma brucei gambiense DAL972]|uniref:Uncharacterized protein n=1 Tax=Trypanosoma brucei gambiense (strain MHOM/CI/86/DAL972) TaxID=679716 RepID=D0A7J5_TRYB9|nr:hypothetical protein, unlikely [Trypanosoma brucei gambiense DAL972]CBH17646.1 hypothetical protein, unlikely [Trypanosoma brucei gambiense DAL972]|eukprot:XP_011779910.1 hypothetical protein, unlikely [Trypanosoma brucei gambiense DAL972]
MLEISLSFSLQILTCCGWKTEGHHPFLFGLFGFNEKEMMLFCAAAAVSGFVSSTSYRSLLRVPVLLPSFYNPSLCLFFFFQPEAMPVGNSPNTSLNSTMVNGMDLKPPRCSKQ